VFAAGKWAVLILGLSRLINSTLNVGVTVLSYSKIYYYSLFFTILLTILAWWLNARWVDEWGVNGAAFATLVAYMVHYVLLLALIRWKIGTLPLSSRQLLVLLVVGVLFGLNWLWSKTLTPCFVGQFGKPVYGLVIDSLLKSILFLAVGLFSVYKLKISESVNRLIDKGLKAVRLKR
jgi:Na+-driven multidrug efflux pump